MSAVNYECTDEELEHEAAIGRLMERMQQSWRKGRLAVVGREDWEDPTTWRLRMQHIQHAQRMHITHQVAGITTLGERRWVPLTTWFWNFRIRLQRATQDVGNTAAEDDWMSFWDSMPLSDAVEHTLCQLVVASRVRLHMMRAARRYALRDRRESVFEEATAMWKRARRDAMKKTE